MSTEISQFQIQMEWFAMRAAIEALILGDAQLITDAQDTVTEIRWHEPICDPSADRLIGIVRSDDGTGGWSPLIEAGTPN